MTREQTIDYMAHVMKEYDDRRAKHTWRELAEVALQAHMDCLNLGVFNNEKLHSVQDANLLYGNDSK